MYCNGDNDFEMSSLIWFACYIYITVITGNKFIGQNQAESLPFLISCTPAGFLFSQLEQRAQLLSVHSHTIVCNIQYCRVFLDADSNHHLTSWLSKFQCVIDKIANHNTPTIDVRLNYKGLQFGFKPEINLLDNSRLIICFCKFGSKRNQVKYFLIGIEYVLLVNTPVEEVIEHELNTFKCIVY